MGFRDEIGLVVRIGPVVGIGLFGGTGLVVSLKIEIGIEEKIHNL